jgi:hypothetical protein
MVAWRVLGPQTLTLAIFDVGFTMFGGNCRLLT